MNLPRRRRSRPKGRARLALAGDFTDTGESVTEILERVRPADYDGSTVIFAGASDAGLPGGAYPQPAPVTAYKCPRCRAGNHCQGVTVNCDCPCTGAAPLSAPAARTHSAAGKGWSMIVRTDGPGGTWNPRLRAAHTLLKLKWAYLEQRGMGYRIDEAEQVLERGEDLPAGSVIAETHREAVTHLVGDPGEWAPAGGWNHGWADSLPWYRPEDGDTGLPLSPGGAA